MQVDLTLYRSDEPLIKSAGIRYQVELYTGEQRAIWNKYKEDKMAQCPKCNDVLMVDPIWIAGNSNGREYYFSPCSAIICVKCDYIKRDENDKVLLINYNKKASQYSRDFSLFDFPKEMYQDDKQKTRLARAIYIIMNLKPKKYISIEELRDAYKSVNMDILEETK